MTLLDVVRVVYFFGPAYAADVSPIRAERLLPRFDVPIEGGTKLRGQPLLGAHKTWRGFLACVAAGVTVWEGQRILYHVPPLGVGLAVLPLVFVSDIVATTLFWRFGLKQSWI
jgi:CDP-archaeol synthase